ncbi:hypothetical protein [Nocardia africana]|uniref:hypothetical protein n=1 Tax=Nocardia africana TaxID=134964 RepID=UPI000A99C1E0|nr:hypothetical protein [Nocardia africana]MCC3311812.1 hypothetical protein [Nocardia africana]
MGRPVRHRSAATAARNSAEPLGLLAATESGNLVRHSGFAATLRLAVPGVVVRRRVRRG